VPARRLNFNYPIWELMGSWPIEFVSVLCRLLSTSVKVISLSAWGVKNAI
jgi:hypothetical protein